MTTKAFKSTDISKYEKLLSDLKQFHSPKAHSQTHSLQQSTHISQYKDHDKDKDLSMLDVNCPILTLDDICRTESYSQWQLAQHNQLESMEKRELKQINDKLFVDNKALIKQCIRLRKVIAQGLYKHELVAELQQVNKLQIVNLQHQNQINSLKIQNLQLKIQYNNNASNFMLIDMKGISNALQQLRSQNQNIQNKITSLKCQQKLNNNGTTNIITNKVSFDPTPTIFKSYTTQDSRPEKCQCDKQRTINKIKALEQKIHYLQSYTSRPL